MLIMVIDRDGVTIDRFPKYRPYTDRLGIILFAGISSQKSRSRSVRSVVLQALCTGSGLYLSLRVAAPRAYKGWVGSSALEGSSRGDRKGGYREEQYGVLLG